MNSPQGDVARRSIMTNGRNRAKCKPPFVHSSLHGFRYIFLFLVIEPMNIPSIAEKSLVGDAFFLEYLGRRKMKTPSNFDWTAISI